jgi:hypothetical protein
VIDVASATARPPTHQASVGSVGVEVNRAYLPGMAALLLRRPRHSTVTWGGPTREARPARKA